MSKETVVIKKMGINGEGVGYINNKIIFIKGALTGEEVVVEIDEVKPRYMVGHSVKILKKSSMRRPAKKNDNHTYGSTLFHMNYLDQLPYKKGLIKDAISKFTKFDSNELNIKPVLNSEVEENYRQYASFPIVYSKGKLIFSDLKDIDHFLTADDLYRLQDRELNLVLRDIAEVLNKHKCKDYYPRVKNGLRYIMVRKLNDEMQVVIVTGKDGIAKEVTKDLEKIKSIASLYFTINTSSRTDFKDKGYKRIYGKNMLTYSYEGLDFEFNVKSSVLMNPEMEEEVNRIIKERIDEESKILSIHPKLSLLELSLDNEVIAIDDDKIAIDDALRNKERFNEYNKTFKLGNIDDEVVYLCKKNNFDTILLHLNQEEISDDIVKSIMLSKIPQVIITTKNMTTLGKSIALLESRYHIEFIQGVDTDPNTPLVNAIVELRRND